MAQRSHIRAAYADRIARFRATVSLAIVTRVASTLNHLSKGEVDPTDRSVNGDDSAEDVLAL